MDIYNEGESDEVKDIEEILRELEDVKLGDLEFPEEKNEKLEIEEIENIQETFIEKVVDQKKTISRDVDNTIWRRFDSWVFPLALIENELIIKEGDYQEYRYNELKGPDGSKTGLYSCVMKDSSKLDKHKNPKWIPLNGTLTRRYVVVNMNAFIKQYFRDIRFTLDPIVYHKPYHLSKQIFVDYSPEICSYNELENKIKYLRGISGNLTDTKVYASVLISNSYNGRMSLRMDTVPYVCFNFSTGETVYLNDFFTLCNNSLYLEDFISRKINVFDYIVESFNKIENCIEQQKNIETNEETIRIVNDKFYHKKNRICQEQMMEIDETTNMFNMHINSSLSLMNFYFIDSHKRLFSTYKQLLKTN